MEGCFQNLMNKSYGSHKTWSGELQTDRLRNAKDDFEAVFCLYLPIRTFENEKCAFCSFNEIHLDL